MCHLKGSLGQSERTLDGGLAGADKVRRNSNKIMVITVVITMLIKYW